MSRYRHVNREWEELRIQIEKKRERKETLKLSNQNRSMRRCELPSLNLKFNKSSLETQSIDSPSRRKKDFLSKFELIGSVLWTANVYSPADFYRVFSLEFSYVVTTQLNLFFPTCTLRKLSSWPRQPFGKLSTWRIYNLIKASQMANYSIPLLGH